MATINGTHVNFVKVPTLAKFNDLTNNGTTTIDGTIYFIVDAKKIYLDGVMYGFNDSDIDLTPFLKHDGSTPMTGNLEMDGKSIEYIGSLYIGDSTDYANIYTEPQGMKDATTLVIHLKTTDDVARSSEVHINEEGINIDGIGVIKGLSYIDEEGQTLEDAFNDMDPTTAVPYGTLQKMRGQMGGLAELDATGKVPSGQLPSYVDDIVEFTNKESFPAVGEAAKLYVDLTNSFMYRWGGTAYYNVSDGNSPLKLGTTSTTAYYGDKGKTAYDHSQLNGIIDNPHNITRDKVGLGNVQNYGIATKDIAEKGTSSTSYMTPQRTAEAIAVLAPKLAWTVVA